MRQPGSRHNREREHSHTSKSGSRGTSSSSGSGGGGSTSQQEPPDVIVNGRANDSSDSTGSTGHRGRQSPHGLELENKGAHLGQASNPNRAEMPNTGRRKSYEAVSYYKFWCHGDPLLN